MKILNNANPEPTSDFWYDLFVWWYFNPEKFIEWSEDIKKINDAISIIEEYKELLEEEWMIDEM